LPMGARTVRGKRYEYAFTVAIKGRMEFNEKAKEAARPKEELMPGDPVLCRGVLAKLDWFDEATGRCGVTFSFDGEEDTVPYESRFVEAERESNKKCARLQRVQPTLMPPPRATRCDAITEETKEHVRDIFQLTCPTSPQEPTG